ncbi:MAG: hypothetical protein LBS02_12270 [Hungatella sp.]|jgi:hypothetical protein|nr:hypothetical protein [Hungatella sp.]
MLREQIREFRNTLDLKAFLDSYDFVWDNLKYHGGTIREIINDRIAHIPKDWGNGGLIGNGLIGANIYKNSINSMRWGIGRGDIDGPTNCPELGCLQQRLSLGDVILEVKNPIKKESLSISLRKAEVDGVIETDKGTLKYSSIAYAKKDCIIIDAEWEGEVEFDLSYVPSHGMTLKHHAAKAHEVPERFFPPAAERKMADNIEIYNQKILNESLSPEGQFSIGLASKEAGNNHRIWYISIGFSRHGFTSEKEAVEEIKQVMAIDLKEIYRSHQKHWEDFYRKSIVKLPEKYWERFYLMQLYKLGCCTRPGNLHVIDNMGVWPTLSAWPAAWWNLNVQLIYSSMQKANHLELMESLIDTLEHYDETLSENARPLGIHDGWFIGRSAGCDMKSYMPSYEDIMEENPERVIIFELGNITWALHCVYRYYKSTMDQDILKRFYPMLKKAANSYLRITYKKEDGKWHLPMTSSPEYPGPIDPTSNPVRDANYDLSLFRWALITLIESAKKLGIDDEPLMDTWTEHLENLTDYSMDETGYTIGKDLPLTVSHRHYSHLLQFFPLHIVREDKEAERKVIEKSIKTWMSMPEYLQGYSFTGSAAMLAALGDGNYAYKRLSGLKDFLNPNTLYTEGGGPVIETPLSANESIHYMLMQCHGDNIKIFPAMPDVWNHAEFYGLLAEGGFEVSARYTDGETEFVYIKSIAGEPLLINPNFKEGFVIESNQEMKYETLENGCYQFELKAGEDMLLLKNPR